MLVLLRVRKDAISPALRKNDFLFTLKKPAFRFTCLHRNWRIVPGAHACVYMSRNIKACASVRAEAISPTISSGNKNSRGLFALAMKYKNATATDEGTIYFVRCGYLVKIGFTTNLKTRIRALRGEIEWSNASIKLLLSFPGDLTMEGELHRFYEEYRVKLDSWREWFYLKGKLREYLESEGCDCSFDSSPLLIPRSNSFVQTDDKLHEPSADRFWIPREAPNVVMKQLMKNGGITQTNLAKRLGCEQSNISHILRGKQPLTAPQIDELSRIFNVPHSMFFGLS